MGIECLFLLVGKCSVGASNYTQKSKTKLHSQYLNKRLDLWENGKFEELLKENRCIQQKQKNTTSKSKRDTPEHITKVFARLMLLGKVHAALRLLDKKEDLPLKAMLLMNYVINLANFGAE